MGVTDWKGEQIRGSSVPIVPAEKKKLTETQESVNEPQKPKSLASDSKIDIRSTKATISQESKPEIHQPNQPKPEAQNIKVEELLKPRPQEPKTEDLSDKPTSQALQSEPVESTHQKAQDPQPKQVEAEKTNPEVLENTATAHNQISVKAIQKKQKQLTTTQIILIQKAIRGFLSRKRCFCYQKACWEVIFSKYFKLKESVINLKVLQQRKKLQRVEKPSPPVHIIYAMDVTEEMPFNSLPFPSKAMNPKRATLEKLQSVLEIDIYTHTMALKPEFVPTTTPVVQSAARQKVAIEVDNKSDVKTLRSSEVITIDVETSPLQSTPQPQKLKIQEKVKPEETGENSPLKENLNSQLPQSRAQQEETTEKSVEAQAILPIEQEEKHSVTKCLETEEEKVVETTPKHLTQETSKEDSSPKREEKQNPQKSFLYLEKLAREALTGCYEIALENNKQIRETHAKRAATSESDEEFNSVEQLKIEDEETNPEPIPQKTPPNEEANKKEIEKSEVVEQDSRIESLQETCAEKPKPVSPKAKKQAPINESKPDKGLTKVQAVQRIQRFARKKNKKRVYISSFPIIFDTLEIAAYVFWNPAKHKICIDIIQEDQGSQELLLDLEDLDLHSVQELRSMNVTSALDVLLVPYISHRNRMIWFKKGGKSKKSNPK